MEKGGGDGRTYPPEHHLGGWKPALTVHDAASAPIELPFRLLPFAVSVTWPVGVVVVCIGT